MLQFRPTCPFVPISRIVGFISSSSGKEFARIAASVEYFASFRRQRIRDAPGDAEVGIIPEDPVLVRGIVEVAALIEKLNGIGQGHESRARTRRE